MYNIYARLQDNINFLKNTVTVVYNRTHSGNYGNRTTLYGMSTRVSANKQGTGKQW